MLRGYDALRKSCQMLPFHPYRAEYLARLGQSKQVEYALDVITKIIEVSSTRFVESTTLKHFRIFHDGDKEKWAPNGIAQSRGERK